MTGPVACVVIPTRNRRARVERLLSDLVHQQIEFRIDVVVVDDGSDDGVTQLERPAGAGYELTVLRHDRCRGPAAARNTGWRSTDAPWVVFTDDDCTPRSGWLGALLGAMQTSTARTVLEGPTLVDPAQVHRIGPWSHQTERRVQDGRHPTCNIAYPTQLLESLGGFDEEAFAPRRALGGRGRCPWGEDTDLALRAAAVGASFVWVPEAVVDHDVSDGTALTQARDLARAEGLVVLASRHGRGAVDALDGPTVRPTDVPAAALAASLASLGARRSAWRFAAVGFAAITYAAACRRTRPAPHRRRDWLRVLPVAWLVDLYAVACLVRASVAHRTLLL